MHLFGLLCLIHHTNYLLDQQIEALEKQAQEQQLARSRESIRQNADLIYRSERGFVYGNPNGNVTVVEFFDYNCGFCKRSLADVMALVDADPNLKLILKEFFFKESYDDPWNPVKSSRMAKRYGF